MTRILQFTASVFFKFTYRYSLRSRVLVYASPVSSSFPVTEVFIPAAMLVPVPNRIFARLVGKFFVGAEKNLL